MKFDREKIKKPDCDAVWIADDLFLASEPSRALERSAAFPLEKQSGLYLRCRIARLASLYSSIAFCAAGVARVSFFCHLFVYRGDRILNCG
jgi:hypothetical protein